jgi:hypothetical protein
MKAIFKTNIKRESGKLYFCKSDKNGIIWVFETEQRRKKKSGEGK